MKFQLSIKLKYNRVARKEIEARDDKDLDRKIEKLNPPWDSKERLTIRELEK
jgi:cytidylate kinase